MSGADLAGTDLTGADFSGAGLTILEPTFQSGQGIGGYDLVGSTDRIIAFDYDADLAHPTANHLVCYRPGHGACAVLARTADAAGNVTFDSVYFQGDPGSGIGGYTLADPADQMIAFDYGSTGNLDHLVCYRPGAGLVSVVEKKKAADGSVTFDTAWTSTTGIGGSGGGCDLTNPLDRIVAFDLAGTGRLDHLVCYRPGRAASGSSRRTPARTAPSLSPRPSPRRPGSAATPSRTPPTRSSPSTTAAPAASTTCSAMGRAPVWYSWSSPPTRSYRWTVFVSLVVHWGSGRRGADWSSVRCGRWRSWCSAYVVSMAAACR